MADPPKRSMAAKPAALDLVTGKGVVPNIFSRKWHVGVNEKKIESMFALLSKLAKDSTNEMPRFPLPVLEQPSACRSFDLSSEFLS